MSQDGLTWFNLNIFDRLIYNGRLLTVNPLDRTGDMNGFPHQVGIAQSTPSLGFAEFENFRLGRNLIAKPYNPIPTDGGSLDLLKPTLSWDGGDFVEDQQKLHFVYIGSDYNNVMNAKPGDPEWRNPSHIHRDCTGRYYYDASDELFEPGVTYYWRVDQVNNMNDLKGDIWRFTAQDFSAIDNFERNFEQADLSEDNL